MSFLFKKTAEQLYAQGKNAFDKNDFSTAKELWGRSVKLLARDADATLELAMTYHELGAACLKQDQIDEALRYFKMASEIREHEAPGSLELADTYNHMGTVHMKLNELDAALHYYQKALTTLESHNNAPLALDVATTYSNLGAVFYKREQFTQAFHYHNAALVIREQDAPDTMELATTYYNLGVLYMKQNQLTSALDYHKKALAIREAQAPISLDLANSLAWLGVVCDEQNRLDDALFFYEKAQAIEELMAPDSLDLATTYSKLGYVYYRLRRMDEAMRYYNKVVVIREQNAPDSLELATTYNNLAIVYEHKSDLNLAHRCYRKVLAIREPKGFDSIELAKTYTKLGGVCERQQLLEDALRYYEQALAVHKQRLPNSMELAATHLALGQVYEKQVKLDQAKQNYERARAIQAPIAPGSLELASTLTKLGYVLLQQMNLMGATAHLDQAIAIFHANGVSSGFELAKAHNGEGMVLSVQGQPDLALEQFEYARAILEASDHISSELARTYHGMADVCYSIQQDDDAIRYFHLAMDIYSRHDPNGSHVEDIQAKLDSLQKSVDELDVVAVARSKLRQVMTLSGSDMLEPAELPIEYIDLITTTNELGKGYFGTVLEGRDDELETKFAVKIIHEHLLQQDNVRDIEFAQKTFKDEIETLRKFRHPHIAKLYGYHLSDDLRSKVCLVFEMAEKGSLEKFWKGDFERSQLSWEQRLQVALDVATALSYLHGGGDGIKTCFHRDIKSANICLKANFRAQLIDCGLAKFIKEEEKLGTSIASTGSKKVGTPGYICPLYQRDAITYCDKCDVYSFGVVLMELIVGRVQNHKDGESNRTVNFSIHYVVKRSKNLIESDFDDLAGEWPESVIKDFAALAVECMNEVDEEDRPSMSSVVKRLQTMVSHFCRPAAPEPAPEEIKVVVGTPVSASHVPSPLVKNTCRQCMVESDQCLPCNNFMAPHFHCKSCLDCHVRNNVSGKEIRCPMEGCRSLPFTDEQICLVAEHNTYALFISTRMYNRLYDMMMRNHLDGQATMQRLHNEDMDMMTPLRAGRMERCPRLFVLVEADSPQLKHRPKEWLHRRISIKARLYFVCAHSYQLVEPPVKLTVSKEWWVKVEPAVNAALFLIRAFGPLYGGSLPLLDLLSKDDDMKGKAKRAAKAEPDPAKAKKLLGKAYELIADKAQADGSFYDTMTPVNKDGEIVWVLKQYKDLYQRAI